jgi:UDP-N-acetylglucosamine 2-epimerase (non-hydrolysing)
MNGPKHILFLVGTRPEAIKLFPVINHLKLMNYAKVTVVATAQHRQLLDQVLKLAHIDADFDLDVMKPNQGLDQLSARLLTSIGEVLDQTRPDRIVVQGDTATAMIGAIASYYRRIPLSHVEAGLRSGDIYAPWPEEVNRRIVTAIADQHFAPTPRAAEALRRENISEDRIYITGNTVVDALLATKALIEADPQLNELGRQILSRHNGRRVILVTTHRRENFGGGMNRIADALLRIAERQDVAIVLPVHPNPNVRDVFCSRLSSNTRIEMIAPQEYVDFVGLLSIANLVLTDSGGIQEEAPALGKPVLVMRDTTERPEGVEAGTTRLVGTDTNRILAEVSLLLDDPLHYSSMARIQNCFGDGKASERIVRAILNGGTSES